MSETVGEVPGEIVVRNAEGEPFVMVVRACEGVVWVCPARGDRNHQLDSVFTVRDAQAIPLAHALLRVAGADLWAAVEDYVGLATALAADCADATRMPLAKVERGHDLAMVARARVRALLGLEEEDGGG